MPHVSFIAAGRLGNFMFECSNAFSFAKKHRLKFTVPFRCSSEFWSPLYLTHLQDPTYNEGIPTLTIEEKQFHYAPIEYREEWRNMNINLSGYFQSELYFKEYRDEMLEAYNLDWHLIDNKCAVHARFGDYLTIEGKHILTSEEYLVKAIEIIKSKTGIRRFKVFSDDIPYFKSNFGKVYDFEYSDNKTIWEDFIEMSWYHSSINSSSTFSWWASWVGRNDDKVVVTPQNWFQPGWDNADTKDIVPSNWIKI